MILVEHILEDARKRLAVLSLETSVPEAAGILANPDTPLRVVCDSEVLPFWMTPADPRALFTRAALRARSSARSQRRACCAITTWALDISKSTSVSLENLRSDHMKIVVIGGTGLIGSKLVALLRQRGQEVLAASPSSGVNTLTGEGLPKALAGAQVVVDLANSPSFEDTAVMKFFQAAGRNLLPAEATAGVRYHVALSIVGADRLPDSGYLRAKVAQEELIKASGVPYTILRSTQFAEFGGAITDAATDGDTVRVPDALIQPIVSDDVVSALAEVVLGPPVSGTVEVGGPERLRFDAFVSLVLRARNEKRKVVADRHARYFGTELADESLVTGSEARIGQTRFETWISRSGTSR